MGPRDRYREQTRGEIKDIALAQLAEGGISSIALTRIAKDLGLSGPALYRYFASRDDLLSALIGDAFEALAAAVAAADATARELPPRRRLLGLAAAYRRWALAEPHRYMLIAGTPLPGYEAPPETLEQARRTLGPIASVFEHAQPAAAASALVDQMNAWVAADAGVRAWAARYVGNAESGGTGVALAAAVQTWTRLHGLVSLEVEGQFTGMGHDPATLLEVEMGMVADSYGLD